ncbi:uncharacterized protein K452DRAFT_266904 [Aplosporella prunicola CBS 121167]|uniref:Uncharacterized protein n=1 Tax=Aplosporella prunicola CBS 121167 TaxID=1176127 RepID=A0A6A6BNF0_9PEZI|nr:uncharacterized protein K452DRAFT_266904 [Aplosporella prunicola CBS 121167]KAF2144795.1 hypothetical protein K452DRAFT_266904 [Aplosporella prunicola CBS 121167]
MRVSAVVSVLCTIAATILSFLCLFAGWKPDFLEDASIMTLDISKLLRSENGTNTIVSYKNTDASSGSASATTGDHAWYSVHVMNYCEGNFESDGSKTLISCSTGMAFFSFDPIEVLKAQSEGPIAVSFKGDITTVGSKMKDAYKATFFLLCMGLAAAAIEVVLSIVAVIMDLRRPIHGTTISFINLGLATTAFLGLGLASGIITGVMIEAVKKINQSRAETGLVAAKGDKFLAMAWAATGLMLLATCLWLVDYSVERSIARAEIEDMYANRAMERNMRLRRRTLEMGQFDVEQDPVAHPTKVQAVHHYPHRLDTCEHNHGDMISGVSRAADVSLQPAPAN